MLTLFSSAFPNFASVTQYSNFWIQVQFGEVGALALKAKINVSLNFYFFKWSSPKRPSEWRKKFQKNVDFSLLGNPATTGTHNCYCRVFSFLAHYASTSDGPGLLNCILPPEINGIKRLNASWTRLFFIFCQISTAIFDDFSKWPITHQGHFQNPKPNFWKLSPSSQASTCLSDTSLKNAFLD